MTKSQKLAEVIERISVAMKNQTDKRSNTWIFVGCPVMCNGYEGSIREVHTGNLEGMVTVSLQRGQVCIAISDPGLYPRFNVLGYRRQS